VLRTAVEASDMTGLLLERAQRTTFALTVTSGRSGTKLLAVLLRDALGLAAEHEPAPRVNFVMRSLVEAPSAAANWLLTEKLPAMLDAARDDFYAETSHLFCKVLIQPLIQLGVYPKLIILTRPAREVASSLFRMNVIPTRTENGRLVLLGPHDRGVLRLPDWQGFSDYQLCYWYALEIERRQTYHQQNVGALGLSWLQVPMRGLLTRDTLTELAAFLGAELNKEAFARQSAILAHNQNSRKAASGSNADRSLPNDVLAQERAVEAALSDVSTNEIWVSRGIGSRRREEGTEMRPNSLSAKKPSEQAMRPILQEKEDLPAY
jgi:hypothetical protein